MEILVQSLADQGRYFDLPPFLVPLAAEGEDSLDQLLGPLARLQNFIQILVLGASSGSVSFVKKVNP